MAISEEALRKFNLKSIVWAITNQNPFKNKSTNDLKKSSDFYDEVLKILGIIRVEEEEGRYVGYAKEKTDKLAYFYIMSPFNKDKASIGNGTMISFD